MNHVLITGATGAVGSSLVRLLPTMDARVRALVRDPERAHRILGNDVQLTRGDFGDPASLAAAVEGVNTVFLACGNVPGQVDYECAVIDAAAASGVRRIVKLSARGAEVGASVAYWHWHGLIERHLAASGVPAVVLQPGFSMTNLLGSADSVRTQSALFAPAAGARIAMIDPADVAAVAAVTLTTDGHDGSTYVLTGPEAITYAQVAADLSDATGHQIAFVDIPVAAAGPALVAAGLPPFAAEQVVAVFDTLRHGGQSVVMDSVEVLTGRAPRPFAAFAREHSDAFRGEVTAPVGV
jgi:uncharacterized protein YbjT (DUF2867 family)